MSAENTPAVTQQYNVTLVVQPVSGTGTPNGNSFTSKGSIQVDTAGTVTLSISDASPLNGYSAKVNAAMTTCSKCTGLPSRPPAALTR